MKPLKPAAKRIMIKGTVLTLGLHLFIFYMQYRQNGFIPPGIWARAAFSLSVTLLLIFVIGHLLNRVMTDPPDDGVAKKK